jgi:catechol 2,3-dioxygenase-like lactoylglutathione lyase family enzyme
MIGRLNHVAIAVPDLAGATAQYRDVLGARVSEPVDQPDHGVTVVFVELPNAKIELLHPLGVDCRPAARGCWATANPRSAPTTSRCCSSTRKISPAP